MRHHFRFFGIAIIFIPQFIITYLVITIIDVFTDIYFIIIILASIFFKIIFGSFKFIFRLIKVA